MKLRTAGFTMLELLIVVAIIAMLVGLSAPSLTQAMHSGKEAVSVQKLRQLHLALSMYRADQESSQDFGTIAEMGLPEFYLWVKALTPYGVDDQFRKSPCYPHPEWVDTPVIMYKGSSEEPFTNESHAYEGNLVIFEDMMCTQPRYSLTNQFHPKRGLGVTLNGKIIRKTATGNFWEQQWWLSDTISF